jgi:hypothetical protein
VDSSLYTPPELFLQWNPLFNSHDQWGMLFNPMWVKNHPNFEELSTYGVIAA